MNDVLAGGLLGIVGVAVGGLFGLGQARSNRRHDSDERDKDRAALRDQANEAARLRAVQSAAPVLALIERFLSDSANPAALNLLDISDGVEMETAMNAVRSSLETIEGPLLELVNGLPMEGQRDSADEVHRDLKHLRLVAIKYLDAETNVIRTGGRSESGDVAEVRTAWEEARRTLRLLRNSVHGVPEGV